MGGEGGVGGDWVGGVSVWARVGGGGGGGGGWVIERAVGGGVEERTGGKVGEWLSFSVVGLRIGVW